MKRIILLVLLCGILAGCSSYYGFTEEEWYNLDPVTRASIIQAHQQRIQGAARGFSNGFNDALLLDMQMRQQQDDTIIYPNQNNPYNPHTNPNYWQEQNARRQYYNSLTPGLFP